MNMSPRGMHVEVPQHMDEFGFRRRDLPTEEKIKQTKKKRKRKIKAIGFQINIQKGTTLNILNEIMRFKGGFVC